jgi:hypothetical protein
MSNSIPVICRGTEIMMATNNVSIKTDAIENIVLSKAFFAKAKAWPGYELSGLNAKELGDKKVILPIWHNVTRADVLSYSTTLADKLAVNTARASIYSVADTIVGIGGPLLATLLSRSFFRSGRSCGALPAQQNVRTP